METDISPPYHIFETKLTKEARDIRTRVLTANKNREVSFESLPQNRMVMEVDLNLKCAFLQTKLIIPTRTKGCTHIDCLDLTCLVYLVEVEKKPRQCPICRSDFRSWDEDILVDCVMRKIINEVRPDCEKVRYIIPKKKFYVIEGQFEGGASEIFTRILEENEKKDARVEKIIEGLNEKDKNPMVSLICAMSSRRMNYPCRFKECKHLESFDLEELVNNFEGKALVWRCPVCDSETKKPISDIEVDKSLQQLCLKNNKKVVEAVYVTKRKRFYLDDENEDPFLAGLTNEQDQTVEVKRKLVDQLFQSIISVCAARPHDSLKDGLVEKHKKFLIEKQGKLGPIDEFEVNLVDPAVNLLINFPARSLKCQHLEVCDVKTYLVDLANSQTTCRICHVEIEDPNDDIYIDNFLVRGLLLYSEKVIYRCKDDTFIPKDAKLPAHTLKKIIEENTNSITYTSDRYKNRTTIKFVLKCQVTDQPLKNPISLKTCSHPACIDLDGYLSLAMDKRPQRCPWLGCGEKIIETNLVKDLVVRDVILKKPNTSEVVYNVKEKQVEQQNNKLKESVITLNDEDIFLGFPSSRVNANGYGNMQPIQYNTMRPTGLKQIYGGSTMYVPQPDSPYSNNNTYPPIQSLKPVIIGSQQQQQQGSIKPLQQTNNFNQATSCIVLPSARAPNQLGQSNTITLLSAQSTNMGGLKNTVDNTASIRLLKVEDNNSSNLKKK
jgi:hypothetical protein